MIKDTFSEEVMQIQVKLCVLDVVSVNFSQRNLNLEVNLQNGSFVSHSLCQFALHQRYVQLE